MIINYAVAGYERHQNTRRNRVQVCFPERVQVYNGITDHRPTLLHHKKEFIFKNTHTGDYSAASGIIHTDTSNWAGEVLTSDHCIDSIAQGEWTTTSLQPTSRRQTISRFKMKTLQTGGI